ncbi:MULTISPECIES: flagellar basal body-associated FliL family protein [unclassified Aureimonas]|uniref:flagellar basal body-associated FliL family protein n=1 Tax=unclassified Aureimonas TaxID=2615206 RepID=UPI0006FCE1F4|nr:MULTISPECIES: flagellar basal body-associated FliL family protein [unclassified Aureimonas]KQT66281.1 hypothetical protein ASG62_19865 [Aureimonas sp. Leaf427]KQT72469.1 hypothetical protein ASG54_04235 [Aureimonas sp. Leaf460]
MTDLSADALAAIAAEGDGQPQKPKNKMLPTIIAVVVLTLVAVGAGSGMGMLLGGAKPVAEPAPAETAKAVEGEGAETASTAVDEGTEANPTVLVKLPAVLTNIATPPKTLLRVEAAIVVRSKDVENVDVLAAQIQADTLSFLRTVDLAQIEGSRGLLHLREDLKERAQLRSPAVVDYLIQSMVAQ